jgi:hypothetical protein
VPCSRKEYVISVAESVRVEKVVLAVVVLAVLLDVVVEETNTPMQTYWSLAWPSEPALPSPKKSMPAFQTQLKEKPAKGPKVAPPRLSAAFAAPKHSMESATSLRPAEAQLRPASSRV